MSTAKDMASGTLHSATDKVQSAKEAAKKSTSVQKYLVEPAVCSKDCVKVGSTMAARYVKSEMSLIRVLLSLATVLVVLGSMTVSDFSLAVTKDKVAITKFNVHPPTLRSALLTGMSVGLISILLTLVIPFAFGYAHVPALGPRCSDKKRKQTISDSGSGTDGRSTPSFSTIPAFEAYRKQTDKMSTGGGRYSKQGSATTAADAAAAAAAKKEE
ncbi:hypothetical protein BGW39_009589 [Mortierella sp. 14UC]|nr:hypothetical protein BGW39_009589 [Mortierella sp. 14UC]